MTTQYSPIWNNASRIQTCIRANVADSGSAATSTLLDLQVNSVSKFTVGKFGELIIAPTARTSGSDSLISLIAPADTTRAAGTPAPDITIGLNRTVEFASDTTITNQRAIVIERPTYTFALPNGRINTPSTVHIAGEPLLGPNWIFNDQRYALSIGSGTVRFWAAAQQTPAFQLGSYAWGPFLYNNGWTWAMGIGVAGGLMRMSPAGGILLSNSLYFGFTDNGFTDTPSAGFFQDATGIIAQRNSTNSQIFRLYNTFTDSSNHERLALQFGTYSSVRHAQIAAESAGTGTSNINLVLTPRGTGAFILGPPPDGTAAGGNARGANAVDLQGFRSAANQVASGQYAVAIGAAIRVVGSYGVGLGYGHVIGGSAGGAVGSSSRVDGAGFATGVFAYSLDRERVHSADSFVAQGGQQIVDTILRIRTTGITVGNMLFRVRSGFLQTYLAQISGANSAGTAVAVYFRKIIIKNIAGTLTLVNVEVIGTDYEDNASTDLVVDTSGASLRLQVTGITGETWTWCTVLYGMDNQW